MATKKKEEVGEIVNFDERVEVTGTGKYGLTKDKVYSVHPIKAKALIKKGAATNAIK